METVQESEFFQDKKKASNANANTTTSAEPEETQESEMDRSVNAVVITELVFSAACMSLNEVLKEICNLLCRAIFKCS